MRLVIQISIMLILVCHTASIHAQETLDRNSIYRVDPNIRKPNVVSRDEIKLGFVYKYYNTQLSRHVWGIAVEDGKFRYAFGPGSMQPTNRFDLRLTDEQRQRLILESAPALSRGVEGLGRVVYARLDANDEWSIYLSTSIPKVYDLLTDRRWEWHSGRRVGILHTYGPHWTWEEDRYLPMTVSLQ